MNADQMKRVAKLIDLLEGFASDEGLLLASRDTLEVHDVRLDAGYTKVCTLSTDHKGYTYSVEAY